MLRPTWSNKKSDQELVVALIKYHKKRGVKVAPDGGIKVVNDERAVNHLRRRKPDPKNADFALPLEQRVPVNDDALRLPAQAADVSKLAEEVKDLRAQQEQVAADLRILDEQKRFSKELLTELQSLKGANVDARLARDRVERTAKANEKEITKLREKWNQRKLQIDTAKRQRKRARLRALPGLRPVAPAVRRHDIRSGLRIVSKNTLTEKVT
jgi:septal ring factor EnvC (AmiA/AmiB activator)